MSQLLHEFSTWLNRRAPVLARECGVPGFAVAIHHRGEHCSLEAGLADREEGSPVTQETMFRLGSVTKILTAAIIMQLRDEGVIDIDEPVAAYLPEVRGSRIEQWRQITARQLLSHTSGADEYDIRGKPDLRFLPDACNVPVLFPPGTQFSISNFGYIVLGRLIEVCDETSWYDSLRGRILAPMALTHTTLSTSGAGAGRFAAGHVMRAGREFVVPRLPGPRSALSAPGGLYANAADLLRLALAFTGTAQSPPVHPDTAAECFASQFEIDEPLLGGYAGLSWFTDKWRDTRVIRASGHGFGGHAELRVIPDEEFAIAFLGNASFRSACTLYWLIAGHAYQRILGISRAEPPQVAGQSTAGCALSAYAGTYRSLWGEVTIEAEADALILDAARFENPYFEGQLRLRSISATRFAAVAQPFYVTFIQPAPSFVPCVRVAFHVLNRVAGDG